MNPEDLDPGDLVDQKIGPVTILFGYENGKYPYGNSMLISGAEKSAVVDPCLGVVARKDVMPAVDMVMHSHCHEDHIAGTHLFPGVPWYVHEEDAIGFESLDGILEIYGLEGETRDSFADLIVNEFFYPGKGDVRTFKEGDVLDFGGGVSVTVIHTPGHTRGHSCFLVAWGDSPAERLVYLGDIELTGFGPYYGDAWSDLESFEASIEKLRHIEAEYWLTFHHKGLISSRDTFLAMLDKFAAMIGDRESRLIEYLGEPRTMDDIVEHRFVYRPGQTGNIIDSVERRSMGMHLKRLMRDGVVTETDGKFLSAEAST